MNYKVKSNVFCENFNRQSKLLGFGGLESNNSYLLM
jgi:hypothetical protein